MRKNNYLRRKVKKKKYNSRKNYSKKNNMKWSIPHFPHYNNITNSRKERFKIIKTKHLKDKTPVNLSKILERKTLCLRMNNGSIESFTNHWIKT